MLKKSISQCVMALCLAASVTFAAEALNVPPWAKDFESVVEKGSPKDVDWAEAAKLGGKGNVMVFFDEKGNPEIYVIGRASISAVLDAVDAEEEADEEAEFNAKEAFAVWMSEHFVVKNTRDRKILRVTSGSQDTNGAVTRSSKDEVVTIKKKYAEQAASATWRGMRKYAAKRTQKEYIAVWRWSLTEHKFAKLVEQLTRDGDTGTDGRPIETFDWKTR